MPDFFNPTSHRQVRINGRDPFSIPSPRGSGRPGHIGKASAGDGTVSPYMCVRRLFPLPRFPSPQIMRLLLIHLSGLAGSVDIFHTNEIRRCPQVLGRKAPISMVLLLFWSRSRRIGSNYVRPSPPASHSHLIQVHIREGECSGLRLESRLPVICRATVNQKTGTKARKRSQCSVYGR